MSYNDSPPEGGLGLWYDPSINRFVDDDGYIHHDLYEFFDLWQLTEWKKTKRYGTLMDRNGVIWDLYYPDDCEPENICDHICKKCNSICEIYKFLMDFEKEQNYIKMRKEVFQ